MSQKNIRRVVSWGVLFVVVCSFFSLLSLRSSVRGEEQPGSKGGVKHFKITSINKDEGRFEGKTHDGRDMNVLFDSRTKVTIGGKRTSIDALRTGSTCNIKGKYNKSNQFVADSIDIEK